MSKIFGIGLPKTGTTSLWQAMKYLGFSSIHFSQYPDYDIHYNDFFCDMPIQTRYKFYDERYPNSKFILTMRSLESWLDSYDRWIKDRPVYYKSIAGKYRIELYGTHTFDKNIFTAVYYKFHHEVDKYFNNRSNDILKINICENASWDDLCRFVNRPIPPIPFPYLNKNEKRLCDDG